MNANHAESLINSFKRIEVNGYDAGIAFYQLLFERNPQLKQYFKGDMKSQVEKFIGTLKLVVYSLEQGESGALSLTRDLKVPLENLGRKHTEYGITLDMYAPVEDALMATLEKLLGDDFTPALRESWSLAYREVAKQMTHTS